MNRLQNPGGFPSVTSLSHVGISPVVALIRLRRRCGRHYVSSRGLLVWVGSKENKRDAAFRILSTFFLTLLNGKVLQGTSCIFSLRLLCLQANSRHDPPQRASVAEDQPMYRPSPISYLSSSNIYWTRSCASCQWSIISSTNELTLIVLTYFVPG